MGKTFISPSFYNPKATYLACIPDEANDVRKRERIFGFNNVTILVHSDWLSLLERPERARRERFVWNHGTPSAFLSSIECSKVS